MNLQAKIEAAVSEGLTKKSNIETMHDLENNLPLPKLDTTEAVDKFVSETIAKADALHNENMQYAAFKAMVELHEKEARGEIVTQEEKDKVKAELMALPNEDQKKIAQNLVTQRKHLHRSSEHLDKERQDHLKNNNLPMVKHIDKNNEIIKNKLKRSDKHINNLYSFDPGFFDMFEVKNIENKNPNLRKNFTDIIIKTDNKLLTPPDKTPHTNSNKGRSR